MSDSTILLRDIAGDAAQNAANRVNPSQEQLSQIDHPAEDNTWHDVPNLSRDALKNQAKNAYSANKPFSRGDVKNAGDNATNAGMNDDGTTDPNAGVTTGASQLRDQAMANVPEETQNKAKQFRESSKSYLNQKLPKERRDQSIYRLKKMIVEVQGHQDCGSMIIV